MKEYKRELKGFPSEIVEKMLDYQEQQGNKRDVSIFENLVAVCKSGGGFDWNLTSERYVFWYNVIMHKDFDLFFEKYPKESYPKVMRVSDDPITKENIGIKRVVFMKKNNQYIAWRYAETFVEAKQEIETSSWKYAKDIEENTVDISIKINGKEVDAGTISEETWNNIKVKLKK